MLLATEERKQIARLFNFLLQGEILAFDCATQQSKLFEDQVSRRFLKAQARQEATHAKIFKAGIGILAPRGIGDPIANSQMLQYRRLLQSSLDKGDRAASLLGMQIILEGLGDITLNRIRKGFHSRGLTFRRVRQLIVGQEDAHHTFGVRCFQKLSVLPTHNVTSLCQQHDLYLELIDNLLLSLTPFFEYFEEDPREYLAELLDMIPAELSRSAA